MTAYVDSEHYIIQLLDNDISLGTIEIKHLEILKSDFTIVKENIDNTVKDFLTNMFTGTKYTKIRYMIIHNDRIIGIMSKNTIKNVFKIKCDVEIDIAPVNHTHIFDQNISDILGSIGSNYQDYARNT